jgi:hypothetical protein
MSALDCQHSDADGVWRVCRHLLETKGTAYFQHFTGKGPEYQLVCSPCRQASSKEERLRTVCPQCLASIREEGSWEGITGRPHVAERSSKLHFSHETVRIDSLANDRILDIQPVQSVDQQLWVAVTQGGQYWELDLDNLTAVPLCQPLGSALIFSEPISLHLSGNGRMAAVVNTRGRHGTVVDLATRNTTMSLQRDNYHNEHCTFPIAFCDTDGGQLLIHGTEWNRLDFSDPKTGKLLSARSPTTYQRGERRPEHYLDYFHCGLAVCPNQDYIADNGWVWHPCGVVAIWSARRWVRENVWESEAGQSKKHLCHRDYYWDGPLCWIGDDRLAVWGYGEDDEWLLPAVRIFDVVSGKEIGWFPGPQGTLFFDRYLFSADSNEGTSVWDVATGERLLRQDSFCPLRYHRGTKSFLTAQTNGLFQVSKLRGQPVASAWLSWNGGTVVRLAEAIARQQLFNHLPILADALEEAGCQDPDILSHCRQAGPHTRRCWVLDRILGNE